MTTYDKDFYRGKLHEHTAIRNQIAEALKSGNDYDFPLQVVDTDYEHFLITYQCHEEHRMPTDEDDLSMFWEDYRTHVEDGRERTVEEIAAHVKEQLWQDEMFVNLQSEIQDAIDNKNEEPMQLKDELDKFKKFPLNFTEIFAGNQFEIVRWAEIRHAYTSTTEEDRQASREEKQWFNHPVITLYLRNDINVSEEQLKTITTRFESSVPGNYYNATHQELDHQQPDFCPENTAEEVHDLFANPGAISFKELLTPSPERLERVKQSYESGESYDSDDETVDP